jgi:small subunit ribosomal protein S2
MSVTQNNKIEEMFAVGAHYGFGKSRRHPSALKFIFGAKNAMEVYDLEKTAEALEEAKAFVASVGSQGKGILFVGGKQVAQEVIRAVAEELEQPYVAGRWIGGTLTNTDQIQSRVERLKKLRDEKEKKQLDKYTKKERLLIDREIDKLEEQFGGLIQMNKRPAVLFVVDPKQEDISVKEAKILGIPIVALAGSDNNIEIIDYPIPANDANIKSITYFVKEIANAFKEGKASPVVKAPKIEKKVEETISKE